MKTIRAVFVTAASMLALSVVSQGCSGSSGSSGFPDGTNGSGNNNGGGSGDAGIGNGNGGTNYGDAGFHTGDGGVGDGGSCATATAKAGKQPVYMLIILDGSGSMSQDNKWASVVPALDAFFTDPTAMNDSTFGVGLTVFSDKKDPNGGLFGGGTYPSIQVPIAKIDGNHSAALKGRIDPSGPQGGTPTVAVLQGQYPALEGFNPSSGGLDPDGKKVLVIMTDGVPNDTAGTPQATLQQQCISMAQTELTKAAPQGPITTFVVGVGNYSPLDTTNYDPDFLGHLAQAGGAPNGGCDPSNVTDPTKMCHFQITPGGKTAQQLEQDFLAAINAIRGSVASCTFNLKSANNGNVDPTKVNVVYDDGSGNKTTVPQDGTNGWTYDNPSSPKSVTLHGTSCDQVKTNSKGTVEIVLGCSTITK